MDSLLNTLSDHLSVPFLDPLLDSILNSLSDPLLHSLLNTLLDPLLDSLLDSLSDCHRNPQDSGCLSMVPLREGGGVWDQQPLYGSFKEGGR